MIFFNKYIFVSICLLFFTVGIFSQNTTIDSLKIELKLHKAKDTTRVNILNELVYSYHRTDVSMATEYVEEALELSEKLDYKEGKAKCIYLKGVIQMMQSDFDVAIQYYDESMELYKSIDVKRGIASCYNGKGVIASYRGDYESSLVFYELAMKLDKEVGVVQNIPKYLTNMGYIKIQTGEFKDALFYFEKALIIFKKDKHSEGIANCLSNIGVVHQLQGNYVLAVEYFNKSLLISEEIQDSIGISNKLNNIGTIYHDQEQYDKALLYYEKSLAIQESFNNDRAIASIKNNMATIYIGKAQYDNAIKLLEEAIIISNEIDNVTQLPSCLNNLGNIYLILQDNEKALKYYQEAMEVAVQIEDNMSICSSKIGIAEVLIRQKKYAEALENALVGQEFAINYGILDSQRDAYALLSEIYDKTGDYQKALINHKQYKVLNDSLFNKENIEKITQLEYEYKYQNELESGKNREIILNQKVETTNKNLKESQRSFLIGVIAFLIVFLILVAVIFFMKLRNAKSKNKTILIEQKLLRLQMTPHFMFNALSVLQGMILNHEDTKAVRYLSKFSKLLRITLENSRDKMVPLSQEITAVENYLELQNIEESDSYCYNVIIDKNIDQDLFEVPPMLIQPFIENAIEHGFENKKQNKIIDIRLSFFEKQLSCVITDNGVGVNAKKEKKNNQKKSLATNITAERLGLISKNYKIKGSIKIEDREKYNEQGTIVTLVIPYEKQ